MEAVETYQLQPIQRTIMYTILLLKGILTFESYYPLLLQTIPLWYQLCIKKI